MTLLYKVMDIAEKQLLKEKLAAEFEIKDL